jgi:hypothetical protein
MRATTSKNDRPARSNRLHICRPTRDRASAGENRIHDVVNGGGFSRFRRAAQTEFNLIYELQPVKNMGNNQTRRAGVFFKKRQLR